MNSDHNNLFIAVILCLGVLLAWQYFVIDPRLEAERARLEAQNKIDDKAADSRAEGRAGSPETDAPTGQVPVFQAPLAPHATTPLRQGTGIDNRAAAPTNDLAAPPRLPIQTPQLTGTISLKGARLDDLTLTQYPVDLSDNAPAVHLLQAAQSTGTTQAHNMRYWQVNWGWIGRDDIKSSLPDQNTLWQVEQGNILTPSTPVTLRYEAQNGLIFRKHIEVDEHFMFTVTQSVENTGTQIVTLFPYGQIARRDAPQKASLFVLHEGGIGMFGEEQGLQEIDYNELVEEAAVTMTAQKGWLGLTDKYWATVLIPPQGEHFDGRLTGTTSKAGGANKITNIYRTDYLLGERVVAPGARVQTTSRLFAGAKLVDVIDVYHTQDIFKFDLLIDWGWFYFLTKPMFKLLALFYGLSGNYGIAILIVTVLIKLVFFPLANKSYVTMAKMKRLQPEMVRLREAYADDKARQQQALLELYRAEKLNPMAGCLPILLQVPVFFALYKVLYVTIDMRHQPFFGWIQDLSAPDPTSLFNLFGLIAWSPPQFLMLGIWPIIMGVTMFIQMQMNPPAPDPIQRKIFMFMPLMFTFLLASFPAGLVIYWAWNNFLSILQQGFIMKRHGASIAIFDNLGLSKLRLNKKANTHDGDERDSK
ncbi:MAG: membrane protein insertase YidC [Alphaproteobacteria bacterium]|nr:membrane protein insertase YidC [Alphaproteobacteria bacterium]